MPAPAAVLRVLDDAATVAAGLPYPGSARVVVVLVEGPGSYWVLGDASALPEGMRQAMLGLRSGSAGAPCTSCGCHPAGR